MPVTGATFTGHESVKQCHDKAVSIKKVCQLLLFKAMQLKCQVCMHIYVFLYIYIYIYNLEIAYCSLAQHRAEKGTGNADILALVLINLFNA